MASGTKRVFEAKIIQMRMKLEDDPFLSHKFLGFIALKKPPNGLSGGEKCRNVPLRIA